MLRHWIPEDKIFFEGLCHNPHPSAIYIIEQNLDRVDWRCLSENPNAIHLLEKNPERVDWYNLSGNPNALPILEREPDKIKWNFFFFQSKCCSYIRKKS